MRPQKDPLVTNDLDENTLPSATIEFPVEDLFPWSEVKFTLRYSNNDFSPHDLSFHVRICVVFTGSVVRINLWASVKWGKMFEPLFVVIMQASFVIVNKDTCRNVHCID